MRRAGGLLAAHLLALAPCGADARQPDPDALAVAASWGFRGDVVAECWSPVRFHLSSGARALSGEMQISYQQDAAQHISITLPFATTPGRTVPVEAVLALPERCESVRVRFTDDRGRRLTSLDFRPNADDPALLLPVIPGSLGAIVLAVGGDSLPDAARAMQSRPTAAPSDEHSSPDAWWSKVRVWAAPPHALPAAWMAYDAVSAVVIGSDQLAALPPDALLALRRWLESGGAAVILADDAGDAWTALAPRPGSEPVARAAPATRVACPPELQALVPEAAGQIPARPITLNPRARDLGWRVRWATPEGGALLAEGPVGFGWLTILGTRPERVGAIVSDTHAAAIWRDVLQPTTERWTRSDEDHGWYTRWGASGALPEQQAAIASILDRTLLVPSPGVGVFVVIVLCIVLLAALVGPVDAIALKRLKRRQLSWATALAYTVVASLLAAAVPAAIRSGHSVYARASCVDVLAMRLGPRAERAALSSVFAATSGQVSVVDPAPGSWWRPISALFAFGDVPGGPTLRTRQAARPTDAGIVRENVPDSPAGALRVWTLRTTLDQGPANAPIVTIEHDQRPGGFLVRLRGLDAIERVVRADVRLPDAPGQRWARAQAAIEQGALAITFDASAPGATEPPEAWAPLAEDQRAHTWPYGAVPDYQPARFLDLPGAWRRTRAIDAYAARGRCALIYLELERSAPDVALTRRTPTTTLEVYRVVVPLPQSAPEEPAP